MAQLKDSLVQGSMRVTDTLYSNIINTNELTAEILETPILKAKEIIPGPVSTKDASDVSGNINFYHSNDTIQGHIGGGTADTATSAVIGIYSTGTIVLRPKVTITSGKFAYNKGIKIDDTSITPAAASGTGAMSLGTASLPWTNVYATNLNGTLTASSLSGQVAVENGGTGKASWAQWGLVYADTLVSLNQVSAGTDTYYDNKFQVLTSGGAAAPIWKTALLMDYDMPTLASMSITDINAAPVGVTRVTNSTEIASITHRPITSCGGMVYTLGGYNSSESTYKWQFFLGADYDRSFVRHMDGATWGQWYRMPRISGTVNTAIGGSKTPVYVSVDGEIVAGDQIKNLAYKDSLVASDIPTIDILSQTSSTLTVARGGTGVTSFTNDCVIVATGTTQTLVSRGLKVTGATDANIVIEPNAASKTLTISSKSTLYLNKPTNASIIFTSGGADASHDVARFNPSGMFIINSESTQSSHRLHIVGDSAFNGKIAFTNTGNTLTENASMQYDATLHAIKFIVT